MLVTLRTNIITEKYTVGTIPKSNIKKRQRKPMGKSRINNHKKLAILGTQDTGRRQTKSTQNKTHTTQKTKKVSNRIPYSIIFSFVTYLRHYKNRFALGITLDLRNYNVPAVTYIFPITYYEFAMLICSATPNGCLDELLVNKGLSRISLFICSANGLSNKCIL